ncbi:unnamed protein product, partial [Symbiodinium sp. KB8]
IVDPALGKIARCARSKKNECRSLHTLIHAEGRTFPVEISEVPTPVRVLSGKSTAMTVPYPVLFLSSWCRECFKTGGSMLLGGHNLSQEELWPLMVVSYQPLINYKGPLVTNMSGHSFTSRLLFTVVPSELYHGDETLDCLHEAMVQDLNSLYETGLSVQCGQHSFCLRFVPICIKGDWPYLRKAGHLKTGFTSKVVCHLCKNPVTRLNK